MGYEIHGKLVMPQGVCGIYKSVMGGITIAYAVMDPDRLAAAINSMNKNNAIEAVTALRNQAAEQAKWEETPQNLGFPILQEKPGPTPITEVRGNIQNTEIFCNDVLKALQGK